MLERRDVVSEAGQVQTLPDLLLGILQFLFVAVKKAQGEKSAYKRCILRHDFTAELIQFPVLRLDTLSYAAVLFINIDIAIYPRPQFFIPFKENNLIDDMVAWQIDTQTFQRSMEQLAARFGQRIISDA